MPERRTLNGAEAIGESALRAGCRFFCGYPIQPATQVINYMAGNMPKYGGIHMNSESEIEGINFVWGAAAAGARAMTVTCGTAFSLMQETCAELANSETPCVIVNMARGQGDYFQATRGGGHGDYRHIVLAPGNVQEAVDLTFLAFELSDHWKHPVLIMGDYVLGHTTEVVTLPDAIPLADLPPRPMAIGVSGNHPGRHNKWTGPDEFADNYGGYLLTRVHKLEQIKATEARAETAHLDDAELVVVAYSYAGRFARYAVEKAREEGMRVGFIRPITLWPYPGDVVKAAAAKAKAVAVLEFNSGQMIEDVLINVLGACPVVPIGGMSQDKDGFGVGPNVDAEVTLNKIREVYHDLIGAPSPLEAVR